MNIRHSVADSIFGPITTARGEAVTGLYFRHHVRRPAQDTFGPGVPVGGDGLLDEAARQVSEYPAGRRHEFDLPLAADGDEFQRAVWDTVTDIPFGGRRRTVTSPSSSETARSRSRWGRPSGRIRSALSCPAIASWAYPLARTR